MWQLCINGLDGKNYVVTIKSNEPERTTVESLKELVRDETGVASENQRLLYGAKQLEDGKRLCDYPPLGNGASILLVLRLPGGGGMWSQNRDNQNNEIGRQRNNEDTSNSIAGRKIDKSIPRSSEAWMISLTTGDSLEMPCKHPLSPDALMDYCWSEIKNIKYEIKCPFCETEWSLDVIKRYGGASDIEMKQLEEGIARNACVMNPSIKKCPFCGVFCERQNTSANSVICILCSRRGGEKKAIFCWMCLKPWKNSSMTAASCGNAECDVNKTKLQRLKESPMVNVSFFPGKKIYQLRLCPNCATVIEITGGCKQMTCRKCKTDFCFICLRQRVCGNWVCGSYDTPCELAPIQQVIPK